MPLPLCLCWTKEGIDGLDKRRFVLQENDTGEIAVCTIKTDNLSYIYSVFCRYLSCCTVYYCIPEQMYMGGTMVKSSFRCRVRFRHVPRPLSFSLYKLQMLTDSFEI